MHAASRHGTPSLTSLPKDGGVSCFFWSFIWKVAHPVSDRTQPCLTSGKLMELAGPLGHSPRREKNIYTGVNASLFHHNDLCHSNEEYSKLSK